MTRLRHEGKDPETGHDVWSLRLVDLEASILAGLPDQLELDLPAGPAPPDPAATAPAGAGRLQQRGESSPDSPSWVDVDGPATWPSLKGASQSLAAVTAAAAALVQSGSSSGSTSHGR